MSLGRILGWGGREKAPESWPRRERGPGAKRQVGEVVRAPRGGAECGAAERERSRLECGRTAAPV